MQVAQKTKAHEEFSYVVRFLYVHTCAMKQYTYIEKYMKHMAWSIGQASKDKLELFSSL